MGEDLLPKVAEEAVVQDQATTTASKTEVPATTLNTGSVSIAGVATITLPDHIPPQCVIDAANRYKVPELALLAIMRQESGGKIGVIGQNKDGSHDYGPAQINDKAWGEHLQKNYGITLDAVLKNMCQAVMVEAYILRISLNSCIKDGNSDIWCGVARYHSPTPEKQQIYVASVWNQYKRMVDTGNF